jgi:hypothetical protein
MSILDSVNYQPTPAETAAKHIIAQARQSFGGMVRSFNDGSRNFWNNPQGATPAEIASALGTDAREVFELHYALGQLIASVKPEAIAEGLSLIGQFTMNEDGTVTIIEPPPSQS